jgi:glycosyltransferase involved in cell wall biosynthesis
MNAVVIGIDASRAWSVVSTGTERYSREVITALLRLAPQHAFRLYTRDFTATLSKKGGGEVREGDPERHGFPRTSEGAGGEVKIVPLGPLRLWTQVGLAREIALHPPDVLFIPAHVLPLSQAIRHTTRTVVTIHDVGYRYFPQAHAWRQRYYLDWSTAFTARHAWRVVVDSVTTQRDMQRFYGVPSEKIRVAYPGPLPLAEVSEEDRRIVREKFELAPQRAYALYVGTLQPRKNLRRLIEAWQRVVQACPHDEVPLLVLAGGKGWGGEDLAAEVSARGMDGKVRFTGYVSDVEKSVLMREARALAFPSLYEGFGLPVLEAQSVGVPVVCSNTSSLPEAAGTAAFLVDPLDVKAIADALYRAMFDDVARAQLSQAGYVNIKRFSWECCAKMILTQLENA